MKLKKLDRRNTGYLHWKYYAECESSESRAKIMVLFYDWRAWCWEQWGASKELHGYSYYDLFDGIHSSNPHWCWLSDGYKPRIYLRGDSEASMFTLKWYG